MENNFKSCIGCYAGRYQNRKAQAGCRKCSKGRFQHKRAQTKCTACQRGKFRSGAPASARPAKACTEVTTCTTDQWQQARPTATSDRVCVAATQCVRSEWQTMPLRYSKDRKCAPLTTCTAGQYEVTPPKGGVAGAPFTTDRRCWKLARCTAEQWQSAAPTTTSNRVCKPLYVCEPNQWVSIAATKTSDRTCTDHTTCGEWERETVAGGTHHDRVCSTGLMAPKVCSHVTCVHDRHHCPTHKKYRRCDTKESDVCPSWFGKGSCDRNAGWTSIRVQHHGRAETTCKRGHTCMLQDDGRCTCVQKFADMPVEQACSLAMSGASKQADDAAACFRLCRARGDPSDPACSFSAGYKDTEKPALTMCGARLQDVSRWSHWGLCRSVAFDDIDGDITDRIRYDISQGAAHGATESRCMGCTYAVALRSLDVYRGLGGKFKITLSACDAHNNCVSKGPRTVSFGSAYSKRNCGALAQFRAIGSGSVCTASFCASALAPFGGKVRAATFAEAEGYCRGRGARLCTIAEMRCASCTSGCGGKERMAWTATTAGCNAGEHVAELESGGIASRKCKADSKAVGALRCCADADNKTTTSAAELTT